MGIYKPIHKPIYKPIYKPVYKLLRMVTRMVIEWEITNHYMENDGKLIGMGYYGI